MKSGDGHIWSTFQNYSQSIELSNIWSLVAEMSGLQVVSDHSWSSPALRLCCCGVNENVIYGRRLALRITRSTQAAPLNTWLADTLTCLEGWDKNIFFPYLNIMSKVLKDFLLTILSENTFFFLILCSNIHVYPWVKQWRGVKWVGEVS